jgi:uncharacterized membrane protein YcjF (UPF0283 family)
MSENTLTPDAEPKDMPPSETTQATSLADGTTPLATPESPDVHSDTADATSAKPKAQPQNAGIPVDQRAYQQYQSLAQVVLDSADLATQSAEAAAQASIQLRQTTADFKELTEAGHKKARTLITITSGLLIISLIFFLFMGVRLVSRINQLDVMLLAVG